ncbi:MAG: hypothetical protein IT365_15075 [Candidatus Hydrogenedentes bacterium]|nr:hypothetical protein [Candidatus Hydrogenedentota bacterium]
MIRINLLPHHLRPIKRTPLPYIACLVLFVVALLGMASSFIATSARIEGEQQQLSSLETELLQLNSIIKESNKLEQTKLELADKIRTIDEIVKDRIIWSRQLWLLSKLTPPNFWYSEILVTTKSYPVQEQVLDPQTKKPKINPQTKKIETKTVQVNRPILRVSGYVIDSPDGRQDVSPLTDALTTDAEFSSMFQLEQPSFSTAEFEGFPVKKFTLEFLISAGGAKE